MKNEGGREAGKCSKVVPDRGDQCMFSFLWSRRLFCNVFPYPVCKAELIGDWYANRQGAQNTIIFLIIRQYYWRTDVPCANSNGGPNTKKKILAHCVWSRLPIGGGGHRCANILAHRSTLLTKKETTCTSTMLVVWRHIYPARFKEAHRTVRCASPIFIPIACKLSFTNRKRKYVAEKTTATLKSKQTSIATVRYPILTVACFPIPLLFHYPLPLKTSRHLVTNESRRKACLHKNSGLPLVGFTNEAFYVESHYL